MATAPPPTNPARRARRGAPVPTWRHWLLLGLFFGLGYGLTQRLLDVRWGGSSPRPPAFQSRSLPAGTTLEDLRRQKGENSKPLAADLDVLAREQRQEKEKQEAAKREQTKRERQADEAEKEQLQRERRRLEDMGRSKESSNEENFESTTPFAPPPPPTPLPAEQPPAPASQTPSEAPPTSP